VSPRAKRAVPTAEPFDYRGEFDKVMLLVNAAVRITIDLDGLEHHHSMAEAIGPLLEPTKYTFGGGAENLEEQAAVLRIAAPFIRQSKELFAAARKAKAGAR
jgi:hypothetical protein